MAAVAAQHGGVIGDWLADSAVMGLWEVYKKYFWFKRQFDTTLAEILASDPDGVVFIDYPGFNLRLSRALRAKGYKGQIIYYISPQVWAWNTGRIPRMAKLLNLMICILPFEPPLYEKSGLPSIFVGHPMLDHLWRERRKGERHANLVGFFPGSRLREIRKHFPVMLRAARRVRRIMPDVEFEVAAPDQRLADELRRLIKGDPLIKIGEGNARDLMQRAMVGIVASGTATLEAAYFGMPMGIMYKVSWSTYHAAKLLVKLKWIGMVNILADKTIVNEYIQKRANESNVMYEIFHLLTNDGARLKMQDNLAEVVAKLGTRGASKRTASVIIREFQSTPKAAA
jgi:lipid-A-disaccharide synthase